MGNRASTRKLIIEMARRRQRPGSGSSLEFLEKRTAVRRWPDLGQILQGIAWAVIGAVGTRHYMLERATGDLDILVQAKDFDVTEKSLSRARFRRSGPMKEAGGSGSSWISDGVQLDVLHSQDPWVEEALRSAERNRDLQGLPILPLPYLVLLKFRAGRAQDIADISRMLGLAEKKDLEAVREAFRQFEPEGSEDLESLIALGRLETGKE